MGLVSPVNHLVAFSDLKQWLDTLNIFTLYYLSSWKNNVRWIGWKALDMPKHLRLDFNALSSILQGSTPIDSQLLDNRGWGKSGIYTVK